MGCNDFWRRASLLIWMLILILDHFWIWCRDQSEQSQRHLRVTGANCKQSSGYQSTGIKFSCEHLFHVLVIFFTKTDLCINLFKSHPKEAYDKHAHHQSAAAIFNYLHTTANTVTTTIEREKGKHKTMLHSTIINNCYNTTWYEEGGT